MSFAGALAPIAAIGGIAGSYIQAEGQQQQAVATSEAASYQAQVAANNAVIANQNAEYAVSAGQAKAADVSLAGAENAAKIKNTEAASGVKVNTGSSALVEQSAREVNQLNTERTLQNSQLQAYGYRTQATNFEAEAGLEKMKATSALEGGELAAEGTILSGVSGVAGKWSTGGSNPFSSLSANSLFGGGSPSGYGAGA